MPNPTPLPQPIILIQPNNMLGPILRKSNSTNIKPPQKNLIINWSLVGWAIKTIEFWRQVIVQWASNDLLTVNFNCGPEKGIIKTSFQAHNQKPKKQPSPFLKNPRSHHIASQYQQSRGREDGVAEATEAARRQRAQVRQRQGLARPKWSQRDLHGQLS